jgi:hypothetical protein
MNYVPKICQDGGSMEGSLTLKIPHAKDKIGFLKKLKFKFGEGGKVEVNEDYADVLAGMIDIAEDIIIDAKLKDKESGKEFVKDDLFYEPQFQELLGEVGKVVMEGMGPSKNL